MIELGGAQSGHLCRGGDIYDGGSGGEAQRSLLTLMRRGGTTSLPEVGGHGDLKGGDPVFAQPLEEELNGAWGVGGCQSRKLAFSSQSENFKTF